MLARPDTTCCSSNVSMFVLCLGPPGVCWWWILQRISVSFPLPPFPSFPPSLLVSLSCCFSVCKWLLLLQLYSRTQNTSLHLQNINVPSPGPICLLNLTALSTSWDFPFIVWHETDWIILLPTYHHSHKDPVSPVVSLSCSSAWPFPLPSPLQSCNRTTLAGSQTSQVWGWRFRAECEPKVTYASLRQDDLWNWWCLLGHDGFPPLF